MRAVLAERGDDPSLAAATAEALHKEWEAGESGQLRAVVAALSRPTRIVRGKAIDAAWAVDPAMFELPEEHSLHQVGDGTPVAGAWEVSTTPPPDVSMPWHVQAVSALRKQLDPATASVKDFLQAALALSSPLDAYFEKVCPKHLQAWVCGV